MTPQEFHICPIEPLIRITGFCSAHENRKPAGYFYDGESHDFWECLFVTGGHAGITAGETAFDLRAGEMILHPPGEFHRIRNEGEDDLCFSVISFSADRFGPEPYRHRVCTFPSAKQISDIVRELRALFEIDDRKFLRKVKEDTDPGVLQSVVNRLEQLLLELLRQKEPSRVRQQQTDALYALAVSVMRREPWHSLTVPQIAAACRVSVSTLQKLFARYTGMGVMEYYNRLRMHRARQLLREGCRVSETAERLGFADQNYFSTAYRRYFGLPPSKEKQGADPLSAEQKHTNDK
ncbi:MAG: AraC family transcriptional regulator [Clostridia bacterium]|nr:AraC family transcriptional regulator [Clostridia bacterium]